MLDILNLHILLFATDNANGEISVANILLTIFSKHNVIDKEQKIVELIYNPMGNPYG